VLLLIGFSLAQLLVGCSLETGASVDPRTTDSNAGSDSGDSDSATDTSTGVDTGGGSDTGTPMDTGMAIDTGMAMDTGMGVDTGGGSDTGAPMDTGTAVDTGTTPDTGTAMDTGTGVDTAAPPSCFDRYGTAPGYVSCRETATECEFFTELGMTRTCAGTCATRGGTCLRQWRNVTSSGGECTHADSTFRSCDVPMLNDDICICTR